MKTKTVLPCVLAIAILFCALAAAGCEPEPSTASSGSAWLEGTWENAQTGTKFTVAKDLSFVCDVYVTADMQGRVYGRLEKPPEGIGSPDDFLLRGMAGAPDGDPDNTYNEGNDLLRKQVGAFNNIITTLAPSNEGKTNFVFSTTVSAAQLFFGGSYTKTAE
ncbi:MAG: hypothetical protein FWH38_09180 [Treponema sp.]|nr:hypothetical protein [Treponema sp.]